MQLNIQIDLGDTFADEGDNLQAIIEHDIKQRVAGEVWGRVKAKVDEQITKQVEAVIKDQLEVRIAATLDALISTGEITRNNQKIKIVDHVANMFSDSNRWDNVRDVVSRLGENYANDLKRRYDIAFANRLVVKINEQGLLKEDVARLLLQG